MKEYDFQIIANFLAGKGEAKAKLENLKKFLDHHQKTYRFLEIIKPVSISKIPADGSVEIKEGVICVGGDGTVSETVGYVLKNNIEAPIVVIPTGTANIIATTLKLSDIRSFNFLLKNKVEKIDIGVAEYRQEKIYFLLGFGLGFEEKFLKLAKEKIKSRLGVFSYLLAALAEILTLKKIPLKIENAEIQIKTSVCLLTVFNLHPIIFKFLPLFSDKNLKEDDGFLNLYYIEYRNYFQAFLGTLAFHVFGKYNFGLVKRYSGKEFSIESPVLVGTQVDGELRGPLPVKISIHSQKGRFLVP